jgi:hypothetical protein
MASRLGGFFYDLKEAKNSAKKRNGRVALADGLAVGLAKALK